MRIVIAGSSGFVGARLVPELEAAGHEVVRLVRRGEPGPGSALWHPERGGLDPGVLEGADAVVNLAGANIAGKRWSRAYREELRTSRVDATRTLVRAISSSQEGPRILVNASATGYYGDRGEEELDESSPRGEGFLAGLAEEWETQAMAARETGARVVLLRFGMIVGPGGGALARMLPPFRLGLGGPVGSGRQWWPWVSLEDVPAVIRRAVEASDLAGPVNVTAPNPVRNREFTRTLARTLHRPAVLPAPAPLLRLALGEMAEELLLGSTKAVPRVLQDLGFRFRHPTLDGALEFLRH